MESKCRMALIKDVLWNVVIDNENAPENQGKQAKCLLQRDRALAKVVLSVDPTQINSRRRHG